MKAESRKGKPCSSLSLDSSSLSELVAKRRGEGLTAHYDPRNENIDISRLFSSEEEQSLVGPTEREKGESDSPHQESSLERRGVKRERETNDQDRIPDFKMDEKSIRPSPCNSLLTKDLLKRSHPPDRNG